MSLVVATQPVQGVEGCPFCAAVAPTFTNRFEDMEVVVFGRLLEFADYTQIDPATGEMMASKFSIEQVLKNSSDQALSGRIDAPLYEDGVVGDLYYLTAVTGPGLLWDTPLAVTDRVPAYVQQILPLSQQERLAVCLQHLEDDDKVIQQDAYAEFARAPYDLVMGLRDRLDRQQLRAWIADENVAPGHRMLYFTLLGICGTQEDANYLKRLIQSEREEDRVGLDALIACYLTLTGEPGLPLIEERFLGNRDAEYKEVFSAIQALRFHGNQAEQIPKSALLPRLRPVLKRPDLASLVLPDLARWEDWSIIEAVQQLFLDADPEAFQLRVPALNYLQACPLPEAAAAIDYLREQQPRAVEQAEAYGMFAGLVAPGQTADDSASQTSDGSPRDKSSVPGLAARVQQMVDAEREQQVNPYPGIGWGIPIAVGLVLGVLLLLRPHQG
ncbi:MAG: hypothetical protein AAGF97_02555 [Planctomycetota bacterium]